MQDHPQGEAPYNPATLLICCWPSAGDSHGGQVRPFVCQGHSAVSTVGLGLIPSRAPGPSQGAQLPQGTTQHPLPQAGGLWSALVPAPSPMPVSSGLGRAEALRGHQGL